MMEKEYSWQDYTERARVAVYFARSRAIHLGNKYVTPEYLMLGLIEDRGNVASRVLDKMGVSLEKLRTEIEKHDEKELETGAGDTPTPECLRALENAYREAKLLNNNYVGTEHLLLGLLHENDGILARVLTNCGIQLDKTRRQVALLQS